MKKLNLRLFRMIKHSKGQNIAILIVVITGLFTYTAMNSAITNLETSLLEFYDLTNFGDVYVQMMNFPESEVHNLENLDNVKEVDARIVFDAPMITDNRDEKVSVRIVTVDKYENHINKLFVEKGSRAIGDRQVLIQKQFAEARNIDVGDTITVQINGVRYPLLIKGLVSSPEFTYVMEDEQALMPRPDKFGIIFLEKDFVGLITGMKGIYNDLVLTLEDESKYDDTEKLFKNRFDKYGIIQIIPKEDQLSNSVMFEEINGVKQISGFIPIVFLFVAAAILSAMISRNVKNDRLVIGILKALGYSNGQVLRHYTMYAVSIGSVGGVVGIFTGTLMSGVMTRMYLEFFYIPLLKVKIDPMNIVSAVVLTTVFCTLAGLYGARRVLKISPAESMRPEVPKEGNRILLEKIPSIWQNVTFTWKIVFRNIFRDKKKFVFISLGAAFTVAMSLMTFWLSDLMGGMFTDHYGGFMKMDYNIQFSQPLSRNVLTDLEKIISPDHLEGKMEMPFEVSNGRIKKAVNIIGLEQNTRFFDFKDYQGNSVVLPKKGALLSYNLAQALDVDIGDKVLIDNYIPGRDDVYVEVKGIIKQILGINIYMDVSYMENLTGKGSFNGAYINTDKNIGEDLNTLKNISGVQSIGEMQDAFMEYLDLTILSVVFMVIFSGLLGFVIIYSMTILSINERSMEFSSLRVLGFTKAEIFGIILKENAVMSALGFIYGLPMGKLLIDALRTVYVSDLYTFDAPINVINVLYAYIFTAICLTIAQLITYKKIRTLNFIEALKSRTS